MGLFDFLKPVWMSDNWKKRDKAIKQVERETDQTKLVEIVKKAPLEEVKSAAVKKLNDCFIILGISNKAKKEGPIEVVFAARDRLEELMKDIADQNTIANVAKTSNDSEICKAAVNHLTDQSLLADIAKKHTDDYVRASAVYKLTDQNLLADFAKKDKFYDVIENAMLNLTDQSLLADVAKNASGVGARRGAASRLTDQTVLAYIAKNDKDEQVRLEAVNNEYFTDQEVLAYIAKYALTERKEKFYVYTYDDRTFEGYSRTGVEMYDVDKDLRIAAIKKLTDQKELTYVAQNDKSSDVRKVAAEKLTDKILAKEIYADIAKMRKKEDDETRRKMGLKD